MPELTVYAEAGGNIQSSAANDYAAARAGTGNLTVNTTAETHQIGQRALFTSQIVYEAFWRFDVSGLPDDATSATLLAWLAADMSLGTEFAIQARLYDWGNTLTADDWVPGDNLSALTLLATLDITNIGEVGEYKAFTSEAALVAAINAAKADDGILRLMCCSSRTVDNEGPGLLLEYVTFSTPTDTSEPTQKPVLVIQYDETAPAGDGAGGIGAPLLYRARVAARRR